MKYSKRFNRDYEWYKTVSDIFSFDGTDKYYNKRGEDIIRPNNPDGKSAKECFYLWESKGEIHDCNNIIGFHKLLKTKGSVNLHIKMYAEDRAKGYLPKFDFMKICEEVNAPEWFIKAVENQKKKYYH